MTNVIAPPDMKVSAMKAAIDRALERTAQKAEVLFKGTYHNWESENQPQFEKVGPKGDYKGGRSLKYKTQDTPYVWVDNGTDGPYEIPPKNAPALRFKTGGFPKTFKGSLISTAGAPGSVWRSALKVTHPGIEAREFSVEIAKILEEELAVALTEEIAKVM